jgi:hypothetical protein
LAYQRLAGCFAPLLVSLDYPLRSYRNGDELRGVLWIVNDTLDHLDRLEIVAEMDGREVFRRRAVAAANAATRLGEVTMRLPTVSELTFRVSRGGITLSENRYDLAWHDPAGIGLIDAARDWITWRVLH